MPGASAVTRHRVAARDEVGEEAALEHLPALRRRLLPERSPELDELVAAPDVVDEHVEPALFAADAVAQRLDLGLAGVVDPDREARPLRASTSSAVCSIFSGRVPVAGAPRTLRPVLQTAAPDRAVQLARRSAAALALRASLRGATGDQRAAEDIAAAVRIAPADPYVRSVQETLAKTSEAR